MVSIWLSLSSFLMWLAYSSYRLNHKGNLDFSERHFSMKCLTICGNGMYKMCVACDLLSTKTRQSFEYKGKNWHVWS